MWCTSTDEPDPTTGTPEPHHRIVRIPPGESVVLNSAERAPYLLLIEVLHGDLDFDPTKRSNKEILKKIVVKENERKGASQDLITFNGSSASAPPLQSRQPSQSGNSREHAEAEIGLDTSNLSDSDSPDPPTSTLVTPVTSSDPPDEEEIDLVEQLYGPEESLLSRSIDLSESIILPPQPKNRELDMATWSRSSSMPPSPIVENDLSTGHPPAPGIHRSTSNSVDNPHNLRVLSLDEYSERMRTAAVMLAQLNANLFRDPATAPGQSAAAAGLDSSSALRWLPGSSWLSINPPISEASSPVDTAGPHTQPNSGPVGMKLQPAEAAAIRDRIMQEMLALEEERMERMRENRVGDGVLRIGTLGNLKTAEDEGIIRRELSKADPSAVVMGESWAAKKVRHACSSTANIDSVILH